MNKSKRTTSAARPAALTLIALAGCCIGGAGRAGTAPTLRQQIEAARATATNPDPASSCGTISQNRYGENDGFYWEIGDKDGIVADPASGLAAAGSVQPSGELIPRYTRDKSMLIASSSKWVYGAYVAETRALPGSGGWTMPASYVPFLNFTSGYDNMGDHCPAELTPTVEACLEAPDQRGSSAVPNNTRTPADIGRFYYNSGHLEVFEGGADPSIAGVMHGAHYDDGMLASMIELAFAAKGVDMRLSFIAPILAGGIRTTPGDYATFLRAMLRKTDPLVMSAFLRPTGADPYAVCTNPSDPNCVDGDGQPLAVFTPLPSDVSWHYSITHWIEDDPATGDGSYSSPGRFGFYPWIDSSKTWYGIVARFDRTKAKTTQDAPYYRSVVCGMSIRKAFMTGQAQE
ncbi:MAG: hypothetical protein P4L83_04930 [Nevskia sp.]|nr:hypothetical protein [Nevskia sp.]